MFQVGDNIQAKDTPQLTGVVTYVFEDGSHAVVRKSSGPETIWAASYIELQPSTIRGRYIVLGDAEGASVAYYTTNPSASVEIEFTLDRHNRITSAKVV